jgi:Na+/alanine symporter
MKKDEQGKSRGIKPFNAFSTVINVLMGTGPILLPPAVAAAGLGLSSIWLIIIAILSVMGAEFVLEVH